MSANRSARSRRRNGQSERDQSCVRAGDADKYGARFGGAETGSGRKRWPDDHHPCSKRARSEPSLKTSSAT